MEIIINAIRSNREIMHENLFGQFNLVRLDCKLEQFVLKNREKWRQSGIIIIIIIIIIIDDGMRKL